MGGMSSVELSDEVLARLRSEATRRAVTVETVIAELAARLPREGEHRFSFMGIGASGTTDTAERHDDVIRDAYARKTAADV